MQDLDTRVAVVTGAGSGIGRAVAEALAAEGARVVAADIEQPPLDETVDAIRAAGGTAIGHRCDVSSWESVEALRDRCVETFGSADIVMNNAGVAGGGPIGDIELSAWEWTIGVNLWGVIHGVKAFLPAMIERGSGHVVNTASIAGHLASSGMGAYNTSKHAVSGFTETLQQEMVAGGTGVGVTCLCPGFVATNIVTSERNRPERYRRPGAVVAEASESSSGVGAGDAIADAYAAQMEPALVAAQVIGAIRADQLWLFTDELADPMIAQRHRDIETRTTPGVRTHLLELMLVPGSD